MEELLRKLAEQRGIEFAKHGYEVGDRVRMVNVEGHGFDRAPELIKNGEEGTVVRTDLFFGIMPVFEVKPDAGRTIIYSDMENDLVPFGNERDFSTVIKIEGGNQ